MHLFYSPAPVIKQMHAWGREQGQGEGEGEEEEEEEEGREKKGSSGQCLSSTLQSIRRTACLTAVSRHQKHGMHMLSAAYQARRDDAHIGLT